MRPIPGLGAKAPRLHKFLTRKDKLFPLLREVIAGTLIILVLLGGLFAVAAQPLGGTPVVVVTSGSMMHCANAPHPGTPGPSVGRDCTPTSYGRIGTIDPGDLVFVHRVKTLSQVDTMAMNGPMEYGRVGDVIVYRAGGSMEGTPIIHRALFYVQVNQDGTFTVPEFGLSGVRALDSPGMVALAGCTLSSGWKPQDSGFITKGDNNGAADQCPAGITPYPARVEWVLGKARGEVPWVGLVKLFVDDLRHGSQNFALAPTDAKVMLGLGAAVLIALPYAVTGTREMAKQKLAQRRQKPGM